MPSPSSHRAVRALSLLGLTAALCAATAHPQTADAPGVVVQYFAPTTLPDGFVDGAPLPPPDHVEVVADFALDVGESLGGSPFTDGASVRLVGHVPIPFDETFTFLGKTGTTHTIRIDGAQVDGPVALATGPHALDARFSLVGVADLPLWVAASVGGIPPVALTGGVFTHDVADEVPAVHAHTPSTSALGGETLTVEGFGFTPHEDVVLHFGNASITTADGALVTDDAIVFTAPPHPPGELSLRVETPQGTSNTRTFTYTATGTPPAPHFTLSQDVVIVEDPIAGAWGPDGHLYVGLRSGRVAEIAYDDDLVATSTTIHEGVSEQEHAEILGMTTDPNDVSGDVVLYVSHTTLFAWGGGAWYGPAPYIGRVSILRGPDFDDPEPLVTGLPTSNEEHGPNALVFDDDGDLLIACGGITNAGIQSNAMGSLAESPLSGAILEARVSDPDFDGTITYVRAGTGEPVDDQQVGFDTVLAPGVDVSVRAAGMRNTFDMTVATNGYLYATDNGPNVGFGPALLGDGVLGPQVAAPDELLLVETGMYYGHPNVSRAAADPAQFTYRGPVEPSIPETFRQALTSLTSSTNGVVEYRANTFWGQWRGQLLTQRFNGLLTRIVLSEDGRHVVDAQPVDPPAGGLNIVTAPGGAVLALSYSGGVVRALVPTDDGVDGVVAFDVHPWRGPATGGTRFVVGGRDFTSPGDTTVLFGDVPATLTAVSSRRIEGVVPPLPDDVGALVDITVVCGAERSTLPAAFRPLPPPGSDLGRWLPTADMPQAMADVAADVIGSTLYVVGTGHPATLALDLYGGTWSQDAAPRPFPSRGQVACAVGGRLHVIGGIGGGSAGRVQTYDPAADAWTLGADMPWPGGAVAAAAIGGKVYVAGGSAAGTTTNRCAAYDPATDSWSERAAMPFPRRYASAGVHDGRLWVFGGSTTSTAGAPSMHTDVAVYDPELDAWFASSTSAQLEPLPVARAGSARAILWQGEFHLFGGSAGGAVLGRVDVYDPEAATWRPAAPMPTPRRGVAPALFEGRAVIAGGSTKLVFAPTTAAETYTNP